MAVRKTRTTRSASTPPDEDPQTSLPEASRPEARRPEPDVPRASKPEARQPEKGADEERAGKGAAPKIVYADRTLTVTLPSSSFSPVKYGSFSIPSVSMTCDFGDNDPRIIAEEVLEELQKLQDDAFEPELTRYLDRMKRASDAAAKKFGE